MFTSVVVDSKLVSSAPGKAGTLSGFTSSGRQGGRRSRIASKYIFQSTSGEEAGLGTFRRIDRHCGWQCPNKAHIAYSRWLTDNCLFLIASMCGPLDCNWCANIELEFIQASILSIGGTHKHTWYHWEQSICFTKLLERNRKRYCQIFLGLSALFTCLAISASSKVPDWNLQDTGCV